MDVVGQNEIAYAAVGIIGPLGGKDDRAALQRDATAVRDDAVVGDDAPDRHGEAQLDRVVRTPDPRERHVALVEYLSDGGAGDLQRRAAHDRILRFADKAIEVA